MFPGFGIFLPKSERGVLKDIVATRPASSMNRLANWPAIPFHSSVVRRVASGVVSFHLASTSSTFLYLSRSAGLSESAFLSSANSRSPQSMSS